MAIREEKEIKGIQIGKEGVKLSLFADDVILYIENPKDATRKLLLINEFGNLQDTTLIHRNIWPSYTNNSRPERKIRETIPFTITTERIKSL